MPKPPPILSVRRGPGQCAARRIASAKVFFVRVLDRCRFQVLRAAVDVEALEVEFQFADAFQHGGHALGVDAELLRSAAHFHAGRFELEVGIDAHRHARLERQAPADDGDAFHLRFRFHVQHHAGGDRAAQVNVAFSRTGEADQVRRHGRVERHPLLAAGSDVDAVDQGGHVLDHGRHRIGLHGVVQMDFRRQVAAQQFDPLGQLGAVVGVEGRASDSFGQAGERHAADLQAIALDLELRQRRVLRTGGAHELVSFAVSINSCSICTLNSLRSILPFGLRGRLSGEMITRAGSM